MVKVTEDGKGEVRFTQQQIEKVEEAAKARGYDAYLLLRLWGRRGLRVSETLRIVKGDVRDKGVWVWQKGGERVLKILPPEVYEELSKYCAKMKDTQPLFTITRMTAYNWSKSIAKDAGLDNWERVHPHRWRHFFRDIPSTPNGKRSLESQESDGSQGSSSISNLRGQLDPRGRIRGAVKVKRFWLLGPVALGVFTHAYLTVTGSFSSLSIVDYQTSQIAGYLEVLVTIVLTPIFLWKLAVWNHDRPFTPAHVWDDQNILD